MFTKSNYDDVVIYFDILNKDVKQLLGYSFSKFNDDETFCCFMLLNCQKSDFHPFKNYISFHHLKMIDVSIVELESLKETYRPSTFEVKIDESIWYNLTQIAYQGKLIFLDGEVLATNLPITSTKRFSEVYQCDEMFSDTRKELMP